MEGSHINKNSLMEKLREFFYFSSLFQATGHPCKEVTQQECEMATFHSQPGRRETGSKQARLAGQ